MRSKEFIVEYVSPQDFHHLKNYINNFFKLLGVYIDFGSHFKDRVNDPRNGKDITVQELAKLFKDEYRLHGEELAKLHPNSQAIFKDMSTKINIPFALNWNSHEEELDLFLKTAMRKDPYYTNNREFKV
jgi:hypothetical protein